MLGLARASAGTVLYDGAPLVPETLERIAYVPERSVLYESMTVAEHVEMQRRAYKDFSPKRAFELLEQFTIDPRKKARSLSKGMKTATMVALAIARNADTLILDEPTSGLDPMNQRHVLNLIINESARGATIIFSSHQIGQVERAAERIAIIGNGRIALEGSVDELKADRKIVEGIFPSESFSMEAFTVDQRVLRIDRNGRIVRILTRSDASEVLSRLENMGASGLRVVDLNLEDIFLFAVSPDDQTADVVEA
jgi:ABC-2 type transport system ATP-binding protein